MKPSVPAMFRLWIVLSCCLSVSLAATIPSDTTTSKTAATKSSSLNNEAENVTIPATTSQTTTTPIISILETNTKSLKNSTTNATTAKTRKAIAEDEFMCPKEKQAQYQLFPYGCAKHKDCTNLGKDYRCCKLFGSKRCIEGLPKPIPEPDHSPLFGIIPRKCPKETLAETWWDVKVCDTDIDCWPRVCCPDGRKKYCKTAQPMFEESSLPVARGLAYPVDAVSQYLQCTPPPPPVFDPHPKPCNRTLDCFPNMCCQEAGKRHCRPPRRSFLAFVTGFTQRFNVGIIKDITDNLVIR